jgi:hypothetical protein
MPPLGSHGDRSRPRHISTLARRMPLHPLPTGTQQAWRLARPQKRLPLEVRHRLLDAINAGQPFRTVLRDLGLTSNRVFGLARTDQEWCQQLEAALTASRRDDLEHGTNSAYLHGCVCSDCRAYQQVRMGRTRG